MLDLPRFFLPPDQIQGDDVVLRDEDANHVARVLRMKEGDRLYVLDGLGALFHVQLTRIEKREVHGTITERMAATGEPPLSVTLVQGIPKGEKFDWILQKATELGATRIVPVMTERTVVKLSGDRHQDKLRRWQEIVKEAAEQCERARLPGVESPLSLAAWLKQPLSDETLRLACLERAEARPLLETLMGSGSIRAIELFVGPEGGFAPSEAEAMIQAGYVPVSLGPRILRAETASLAALAIALSWAERAER